MKRVFGVFHEEALSTNYDVHPCSFQFKQDAPHWRFSVFRLNAQSVAFL